MVIGGSGNIIKQSQPHKDFLVRFFMQQPLDLYVFFASIYLTHILEFPTKPNNDGNLFGGV